MTHNEIVPYSKRIPLSQGYFAEVNYHWYEFLTQWRWHVLKSGRKLYASHSVTENLHVKMHRVILGLRREDERKGDHIDNNGINNTIRNLRVANNNQNASNTLSRINSSSKYLGVSLKVTKTKNKTYTNWVAQIIKFKSKNHIGLFPYTPEGEIEAAKAYDKKAKEIHGEFANLNFTDNE